LHPDAGHGVRRRIVMSIQHNEWLTHWQGTPAGSPGAILIGAARPRGEELVERRSEELVERAARGEGFVAETP